MKRSRQMVAAVIRGRFAVAPLIVLFLVVATAGTGFGQGFNPQPKTAEEAINQVVFANRILARENIFDYLGHISVRNPENPKTYFMARGIAPASVTKKDVLEIDLEGNVLTKNPLGRPYGERVIHSEIYKLRPDVNSVVHAHPREAVILSISKVPFKIVFHPATVFYAGVPNYNDYDFSPKGSGMLIHSKADGEKIAKVLGKANGMLMRGHGCNIVGKTVPHATQDAIAFRDNILMQLAAQQFGDIISVSPEEAKTAAAALSGPERPWTYWVQTIKETMPDMR